MLYLRILLILTFVLLGAQSQTSKNALDDDLESLINEIFGHTNPIKENRSCGIFDSALPGCNECYPCDNDLIKHYKQTNAEIRELTLFNASCHPNPVCCVSQLFLTTVRTVGECGQKVQVGRRRATARSTLKGEYPWSAFVYKSPYKPQDLICSATYIDEGFLSLLTTASCVQGMSVDKLKVSFEKPPRMSTLGVVHSVVVHPKFNRATRENDIALIKLGSPLDFPNYAQPLCLPAAPVSYSTPCSVIAENGYLINTNSRRTDSCNKRLNRKITDSQLCTSSLQGDHHPASGTALFCEEENETVPTFTMHGMALQTIEEHSITLHTNISNYIYWIDMVKKSK